MTANGQDPAPDKMAPKNILKFDWVKLYDLYREAELAIKIVEEVWDGLDTTAINQLRYAGNHILRTLMAADEAKASENYEQATRHCLRGLYDAYDSTLMFYLGEIRDFKKDYRQISITAEYPNYIEVLQKAEEAQALLEDARSKHDAREDYYKEAKALCKELKKYVAELELAREELNKRMSRHNKRITAAWIMAVLALIGATGGFQLVWQWMDSLL